MSEMSEHALLDSIHTKVTKLEALLTGNGDPQKGLVVRVALLEQSHRAASKVVWLAVAATIANIASIYLS